MKAILLALPFALALVACSKQESAEQPAPQPDSTADASATPAEAAPAEVAAPAPALESAPVEVYVDNTRFGEDLNAIPDILKNQDYDTAVANLVLLNQAPKNPDQQRAYLQRLYEAMEQLRQQSEQDPRAAAARQKLGQGLMGR